MEPSFFIDTEKVVLVSTEEFAAVGSLTGMVFKSTMYMVLIIKNTNKKNMISIIGIIMRSGVLTCLLS
jgi:hypothetical protein